MAKVLVAPEKVFEHAESFYQTLVALRSLSIDSRLNTHAAITLAEPLIVIDAITTELFLKCLLCIDNPSSVLPRHHNLGKLFAGLAEPTRMRIQKLWNADVVPRRGEAWDRLERCGLKVARDLLSALDKGAEAFKVYRYSYEGNTEGMHYYLEGLPPLLERLILETRPEFEAYRCAPLPLVRLSYH